MRTNKIIFTGESIPAIQEGRKTMTRRVITMQPSNKFEFIRVNQVGPHFHIEADLPEPIMHTVQCPFGGPGDKLWVRESYRPADLLIKGYETDEPEYVQYKSDGLVYQTQLDEIQAQPIDRPDGWSEDPKFGKWKPAIFMPRYASRLTIEIISVRVERVNQISEEDAIAEGFSRGNDLAYAQEQGVRATMYQSAKSLFAEAWDRLNCSAKNPDHCWHDNPWVWVIEFRKAAP